jgi:hypothetical protein
VALVPYQVYPGQAFLGADVHGAKQLFASKVVPCGGIAAAGNVPTIALTTNAGSSSTVTSQAGYDMAGSFVLTAGTAATAAGTIASVTFGNVFAATPPAVLVTAANTTAGATTNIDIGALAVSKTGFSIYAAGSMLTSATYLVNYCVFFDPH